MKQLLPSILLVFSTVFASAQFSIDCDGRDMHAIYFNLKDSIYRMDSVDTAPSEPKFVAKFPYSSFFGISINKDLNTGTNRQLLYASTGTYYFWNDTGWVNTQHTGGNANPGGSNNYIYDLDGVGGKVSRYDGTGNATVFRQGLDTKNKALYDIATDKAGNYYIFYIAKSQIIAFTENGTPIDTFTVDKGGMVGNSGPGFSIVGGRVYNIDQEDNLYEGIVNGKNITFTMIKATGLEGISDVAGCHNAGTILAVAPQPELPRFAVYPNPANSQVRIAMANAETIQIFNSTGQQIVLANTGHITDYNFSVAGWSSGLYLVAVTDANGQKVRCTMVVQ